MLWMRWWTLLNQRRCFLLGVWNRPLLHFDFHRLYRMLSGHLQLALRVVFLHGVRHGVWGWGDDVFKLRRRPVFWG